MLNALPCVQSADARLSGLSLAKSEAKQYNEKELAKKRAAAIVDDDGWVLLRLLLHFTSHSKTDVTGARSSAERNECSAFVYQMLGITNQWPP